MGINRFIDDENRYDAQNQRIYPVDKWEMPTKIIERASSYHFLRVPILGQHNPQGRGDNWCEGAGGDE